MPNPNQLILGKRRKWWVWQSAKALIAATDPALLWRMVDAGFDAFLPKARSAFPRAENGPQIHFTTDEYRWMFAFLAKHIAHEMRKHRGVARSVPVDDPVDAGVPDYVVESASRLVH